MPPTTGAVPPGRRELKLPPKLQGKLAGDAFRIQDEINLEIFLSFQGSPVPHGATHAVDKSDPLPLPLIVPKLVKAGVTAAIGTGPSYMREDAQLAAETGVPTDLGEANAEGAGTSLARALHVHKLSVRAAKAGATVGTRKRLNFADSATLQINVTDDAGSDEIDISGTVLLTGLTHNFLSATHPDTVPSTPVRGGIVVANSTPAWAQLAIGASGRYLRSNATDPSWSQLDMGDAALGTLALARGGTGSDLSGTGGAGFFIKQSSVGAALTSAAIVLSDIADNLITYAKIQDVSAASVLLGRGDSGSGDIQQITLGTNLSMSGTTLNAAGGGGGAPVGASYIVVALDGTLTAERRLQGTANQVILADGGANADLVLSLPQDHHTGAVLRFARLGLGAAADAAIPLLSHVETNDNLPYELLTLRRKRADATAPGAADFGGEITWRLEGFTNDSDVIAAKIRGAWDKAQTNDLADRDSYLAFYTMRGTIVSATLNERVRITSEGSVLTAMLGALATTATDGFLYLPTCAGVPTGVPTAFTGQAPIVIDTTNKVLYYYDVAGATWVAL